MSYILLQIDSGKSIELVEEYWREILTTGEREGWEPEGTAFDFIFQLDEAIDEGDDEMHRLFNYILCNNDFITWNGSYTEKENQIISESDAYCLFQAIEDVIDDEALHAILREGNLRICK